MGYISSYLGHCCSCLESLSYSMDRTYALRHSDKIQFARVMVKRQANSKVTEFLITANFER